ncbi:MAG: GAF domain-containing protein [Chloroflexota bacterium]
MTPRKRHPDLSTAALAALRSIALRAEGARRLTPGAGESVLRSVVDATVALFQAEAASIALYDASTDRLVFRVAAGDQGQGVVGLAVPPDQGLVGYVYTSGQALAISDVRADPRFGRAFAESTQYVPRSIVAVPLADDHGTIGVLEVLDKRDEAAFSLRDIELASVFARQAAVAISATRVERDVSALLTSVFSGLLQPTDGDDAEARTTSPAALVDELVAAATAELGREDLSHLWALVEQVARVRAAAPDQLALVADLLAVLAGHAEHDRAARFGRQRRSR